MSEEIKDIETELDPVEAPAEEPTVDTPDATEEAVEETEIAPAEEEIPTEEPTQEATEEPKTEDDASDDVEIIVDVTESPYLKEQYLRFGKDEDMKQLDLKGTLSYLEAHGFGNNNLTQARAKIKEAEYYEKILEDAKENVHYCDFCGRELGVEYDVLSDGRERCNDCSRTIISSVDELRATFIEIERNMEVMFGINYFAPIDVTFVDTKKLARRLGMVFNPTPGRDPRTLGFAENRNGAFSIWVENQSPYLSSVATISHELTHIWQYLNWNDKQLTKLYYNPLKQRFPHLDPMLIIYEGMAKWAEVQYLFLINEYQRGLIELYTNLERPDEYGVGFALYYKEYGICNGTFPQGATPFMDKQMPLHEI